VIVSLGLVTLDRWPTTTHEWVGLGSTLTTFGLSPGGRRHWGRFVGRIICRALPYANRLVLQAAERRRGPAPVGAAGSNARRGRRRRYDRFGRGQSAVRREFLDVMAEGDYVEPGKTLANH